MVKRAIAEETKSLLNFFFKKVVLYDNFCCGPIINIFRRKGQYICTSGPGGHRDTIEMTRLFGLPIITAILAGILFPYTALSLMPFGFVFLFVLMLLSGLSIDWHKLISTVKHPVELLSGLFFVFILFPLIHFYLARFLITDSQLLEGILFGALMPVAIVAPFFTRQLGGDEELAFLIMVITTLAAPFIAPPLLKQMTASILTIQATPLVKSMLWVVTLPLFGSFLISRYLPVCRRIVRPYLPFGNMCSLGLLIFILFGTAVSRLHIGYETKAELGWLLLLGFVQDFGALFIARLLMGKLFAPEKATAFMVCLSMKNVAIATGVLLFYDPRAAIAPAFVFIAHAFLFSFLPSAKKFLVIRGE